MSIFTSLQRFYAQVLPLDAPMNPDAGLLNSSFSHDAPAMPRDAEFTFSNVPLVRPDDFNNELSVTTREPNTPTSSESEYAQRLSPAVQAVAPERVYNGDGRSLPTSIFISMPSKLEEALPAFEEDDERYKQGLENTFGDNDDEDDSMLFASQCNGKWHPGLRPPFGPNKVLTVQHLRRRGHNKLNNNESRQRPGVNRRPLGRTETYLDVIDIEDEETLVGQGATPPTDQLPVAESTPHSLPTPSRSPKHKSPTSSGAI